ncbi:DUF5708 family protein [Streptomyces sp. NPDC050704]|uniref:DUF5708 family protein n=1 Tax=Streptomyces sp. NPDC050704 TaxID=3157219 RepID=UPI00343269D0
MSRSRKNLLDGTATFAVGLVLWLFTGGVEVPVVTLTKAGLVMMCVGAVLVTTGLYQAARTSPGAGRG